MRGLYVEPSPSDYNVLFSTSRGGSLDQIRYYTPSTARGGSLFGILGRVIRKSIPFIKSIFLPEVSGFVSNVSNDVNSGVNIRDSLKKRGAQSGRNVVKRILKRATGGRKHIKKSRKKKPTKKRKSLKKNCRKPGRNKVSFRTKQDIFNSV